MDADRIKPVELSRFAGCELAYIGDCMISRQVKTRGSVVDGASEEMRKGRKPVVGSAEGANSESFWRGFRGECGR